MIEIRCANGRVVRVTLPEGTLVTATQFAILRRWANEGRSAELITD